VESQAHHIPGVSFFLDFVKYSTEGFPPNQTILAADFILKSSATSKALKI
jgi:hypothetical protein